MAKRKASNIEFPFYNYLNFFYQQNQTKIRAGYNSLTRKFLDFNDPDKGSGAYLRRPQFQALEMYVFLKESENNRYVYELFEDWFYKRGTFAGRTDAGVNTKGQIGLFAPIEANQKEDKAIFEAVYEQTKSFQQVYPNYIFALTMGLGKTILMATSIFYEFLLANKYPKDERYCHNALVFAPDKTVLHSLKEIQTFDKSLVIPAQYVNWLDTHLKFHFLDQTGDALNAIDHSKYNVIISNTQKIILKRQHKESTPAQLLFKDMDSTYKALSLNKDYDDLYDFDIDSDADLITNQRFAKLMRIKQLGVYLDEAHHAFGNTLAADFGLKKTATSLRVTINELAEQLKKGGSKVVGCYNYTGTPYVGKRLLPEVVYAYGLKDAIDNRYLKKVKIKSFDNIKKQTLAFVRTAITEFLEQHGNQHYEKMLPKMAFFASNIEELQTELRPAVETVLAEHNLPMNRILVNVGDPKLTSNDDLREFKNLDSPSSKKQFILLVNKGKEGWNCRSLFGVGLHRQPKSKVFVLQATMRCLRAITEQQQVGCVWLAAENLTILEKELEANFRLSVEDLRGAGDDRSKIDVYVVPPPVKVKVTRTRSLYDITEKELEEGVSLELDQVDKDKYRITSKTVRVEDLSKEIAPREDYTHIKEQRMFSELTLVAEISRYLNLGPLRIRQVLASTQEGVSGILAAINEHNELLYDWVIPRLFAALFKIDFFEKKVTEEIELVKPKRLVPARTSITSVDPQISYGQQVVGIADSLEADWTVPYEIRARDELVVNVADPSVAPYAAKSFHLDNYCFDSLPEKTFFLNTIKQEDVKNIWFTGMLTHGQSDFVIPYIEPGSGVLRKYYPDFLIRKTDGSYYIVEIKADFQVTDSVVQAKQYYAEKLAASSNMSYVMIKATDAQAGQVV